MCVSGAGWGCKKKRDDAGPLVPPKAHLESERVRLARVNAWSGAAA